MAKKRSELHDEHTDETWLIPYADLLTLLLALFIVLYASSTLDSNKMNSMSAVWIKEISEGGGLTYIPFLRTPNDITSPIQPGDMVTEEENLKELEQMLQAMLVEQGLQDMVTTTIDDRGLVISMNDAVLFDPGYAVIKDNYREVMIRIGITINRLPNYIRIEGHTDNVPQSSELYPSNWELSTGRSTSVLRLFEDYSRISPQKLMAIGYGEWRPVADNSTIEGRSKNRRVDIIILSSRFDALENPDMRN